MSSVWQIAALIAGLLGSAAAIACLVAARRMERVFLARHRELEDRLNGAQDAIQVLDARLAEILPPPLAKPPADPAAIDLAAENGQGESIDPSIEPEIQAAIAAAAAVVAGRNAQVRSARKVKPHEEVSPWSHQGRVLVQTSHNLHPGR